MRVARLVFLQSRYILGCVVHTKSVLLIVLALFTTACATERYVSPTITTTPRHNLVLRQPVLASVFDGRTAGDDLGAAAELQVELAGIYGDSLQWSRYFDPVPDGRVALRIRIVILGSAFGSRLVSSVSYENAVHSATISAVGPWGQIVGTGTGTPSVFGAAMSGEGWWNGTAWVDVEVQDRRSPEAIRFIVPIAAEHRESNVWGYSSGDKAERKAWENVAARLTRTIDEIIRILRDEEG